MKKLDSRQITAAQGVGVVLIMGALGWASVPLYDWFCRVTGYGGTTSVAQGAPDSVLDRKITVRFDASRAADMPWEFKAVETTAEIRIGEVGLAFYEAYNPTDMPVAGTASYNVTPYDAGLYFTKIDCFCFEYQLLMPGERVQMPVTFYVDPEIVDDRNMPDSNQITLSYTFHSSGMPDDPQDHAALTQDADAAQ